MNLAASDWQNECCWLLQYNVVRRVPNIAVWQADRDTDRIDRFLCRVSHKQKKARRERGKWAGGGGRGDDLEGSWRDRLQLRRLLPSSVVALLVSRNVWGWRRWWRDNTTTNNRIIQLRWTRVAKTTTEVQFHRSLGSSRFPVIRARGLSVLWIHSDDSDCRGWGHWPVVAVAGGGAKSGRSLRKAVTKLLILVINAAKASKRHRSTSFKTSIPMSV